MVEGKSPTSASMRTTIDKLMMKRRSVSYGRSAQRSNDNGSLHSGNNNQFHLNGLSARNAIEINETTQPHAMMPTYNNVFYYRKVFCALAKHKRKFTSQINKSLANFNGCMYSRSVYRRDSCIHMYMGGNVNVRLANLFVASGASLQEINTLHLLLLT